MVSEKEKYIAIGDIHGCIASTEALLDKLSPYFERKFIFVGDYIDRGPDSKGVIDLMLELMQHVDCIFLRGNHEKMLLDALNKDELKFWLMNGGGATLQSYDLKNRNLVFPDTHLSFFENTRYYYDSDDYFFVHAGVSPVKTITESLKSEEEIDNFLWERAHLNAFNMPWEKTVVFGHTPQPKPLRKDRMIGIDTGCVYDRLGYGKLTAVKLPEEEFVQQESLEN